MDTLTMMVLHTMCNDGMEDVTPKFRSVNEKIVELCRK